MTNPVCGFESRHSYQALSHHWLNAFFVCAHLVPAKLQTSSTKERKQAEKGLAVAHESLCTLESWVTGYYISERKGIDKVLETIRAENLTSQCHIENLEQPVAKQEKDSAQLKASLNDSLKELAGAEKKPLLPNKRYQSSRILWRKQPR